MLSRKTPAHFDTRPKDVAPGLDRAPHLVRVALVIEDNRMNIAVAGMKDIANLKFIALAHLRNHVQDIRQTRARHHAVLRRVIRRQPSDRAERTRARRTSFAPAPVTNSVTCRARSSIPAASPSSSIIRTAPASSGSPT